MRASRKPVLLVTSLFLVLLLSTIPLAGFFNGNWPGSLQPTAAVAGPYHVSGSQILDRQNHPYLIRGTALESVTLDPLRPGDLGGLSASALVTIRQRLNMNAVRLPFAATEYERNPAYRARVAEIVRTANRFELLVILAPDAAGAPASFWTQLAADFRAYSDVFFSVSQSPEAVPMLRAAGIQQPIVGTAPAKIADFNFIYEVSAQYSTTRTEQARSAQFGQLAETSPVLAIGLDPDLGHPTAECIAFPGDPADATNAVQSILAYFDEHSISWTISTFRPGVLITDTRSFTGTKLDDGWTCDSPSPSGLGLVLLSHLWRADPHGLFVVNGYAGSFFLPRGGRATAYGPILADRELTAGSTPRTRLGNVSVRITDSAGVSRLAPLLHTGAGWAFLSLVVPDDVATGPAEIAIVRTDGSSSTARAILTDIAPGLLSASADGRGPASASVTETLTDGRTRTSNTYECSAYLCRTLPISLAHGSSATLRLVSTGLRHVRSKADIAVTIGDVAVPVVSFGPDAAAPGTDYLLVKLPPVLAGRGEQDVIVTVNGATSNVVRVQFGVAR